MISVNDLRTGLTIEVDGDIYSVVDFLHVKPGKAPPLCGLSSRICARGAA